jgi:N-dimethylarginine dimethylaminohydrolase
MDLYLMSPPHPTWTLRGRANFKSSEAAPVDAQRARREWLTLASAIEGEGATVAVLPPDPELTGLPYAAEAGHALPPKEAGGKMRFLLPRMKSDHRKAEREKWKPFVERLGFDVIDPLPSAEAGTWEGQGDVAVFGFHTFLFYGGRTDRAGAEAARAHFGGDVSLIGVEPPAFHGNMAVLPLGSIRIALVCADAIDEHSIAVLEAKIGRDRTHFVSEEEIRAYATNGLPIGKTLLAPSIMPPRTQKIAEHAGMTVKLFEMKELCEKAGGASRCLVCKVERAEGITIPDEYKLERTRKEIEAES